MAITGLTYPHQEVTTPEQVQLFIDSVLSPAADLIEGGPFTAGTSYEVTRGQTRATDREPGNWESTGFQATRMDYTGEMDQVLYHIWSHNAVDTSQIPFSAEALVAASKIRDSDVSLVAEALGVDEHDEEVEIELEVELGDEVVEEHNFFINNKRLVVVRDFDYSYLRNGTVVWRDSCKADDKPVEEDGFAELAGIAEGLNSSLNFYDLEMVAKILGNLGLLAR